MCKRFVLTTHTKELADRFHIDEIHISVRPRNDYIPTGIVPVIVSEEGKRKLELQRWGLIPFWAKNAIWADSSQIQEKPQYLKLFSRQRCVIPCDGFYIQTTEGRRQRHFLATSSDGTVLPIAGFFEIWVDPQGKEHRTCTMLITMANRLLYEYTEHMPAIIRERDLDDWLDTQNQQNPDWLQSLLKPYDPDQMNLETVVIDAIHEPEEEDHALKTLAERGKLLFASIKK